MEESWDFLQLAPVDEAKASIFFSTFSYFHEMAIEIVDLPMNSMVIFRSYVGLPEGSYTV